MMEIKGICGATLTEDYRGCLTCKTSMQRVIGTGTETNISLIKHLCEGCPMAKLTGKCGRKIIVTNSHCVECDKVRVSSDAFLEEALAELLCNNCKYDCLSARIVNTLRNKIFLKP